jgi:hypothetical protein
MTTDKGQPHMVNRSSIISFLYAAQWGLTNGIEI